MNNTRNYGPVTDLHELQQRLLSNNICVNGCGTLHAADSRNRQCPACGFKHFAHPQYSTQRDADDQLVRDPRGHAQACYAEGRCPVEGCGGGLVKSNQPHTDQCVQCGFQHFNFVDRYVNRQGRRW